jgi:hypothetical protein
MPTRTSHATTCRTSLVLALLFALGASAPGCGDAPERASPDAPAAATAEREAPAPDALPELRYYVIADA